MLKINIYGVVKIDILISLSFEDRDYFLLIISSIIISFTLLSSAYFFSRKSIFRFLFISIQILIEIFLVYRLHSFIFNNKKNLSSEYIDVYCIIFSICISIIYFIFTNKFNLTRVIPISIFEFINGLDKPICLIDNKCNIICMNNSMCNVIGEKISDIDKLNEFINKNCIKESNEEVSFKELCKMENLKYEEIMIDKSYYKLVLQNVKSSSNKVIGNILIFYDITKIKEYNLELLDKSQYLLKLNSDISDITTNLVQHISKIEEKTIYEERNRILNDLHDSVGQVFTSNFSLMQCAKASLNKCDYEMKNKYIKEIINITNNGLDEINVSLNQNSIKEFDFENELNKLIKIYQNVNINQEVLNNIKFNDYNKDLTKIIYRVIQESISNSIKNGNATIINIIFKLEEDNMLIEICDNGCGCKDIIKGMGLTSISKRILELDGSITFNSECGFNTKIKIPCVSRWKR